MVALGGCGGRGVLAGSEKQSGKQDESFKVARFQQLYGAMLARQL